MLDRILCVGIRQPSGIQLDAARVLRAADIAPAGRKRRIRTRVEGLRRIARIQIPCVKMVARLGRRLRELELLADTAGDHAHTVSALGLKLDVARILRIAPVDGQCAPDRAGGKGQRAVLPGDGHLAGLIHRAARLHNDKVIMRAVSEFRIAELHGEVLFVAVAAAVDGVEVLGRLVRFLIAVNIARLHIHILHVEQIRRQGEVLCRDDVHLQPVIVVVIRKVKDVFDRADRHQRPVPVIQHRLIGQLVAGEQLGLKGDGQIQADLDDHGAGAA